MSLKLSRRNFTAGSAALAGAATLPLNMARAQTTTLRYGNAGNIDTLSNQFNLRLSETLMERTGGELGMEIFAGTLGGEQSLIEGMSLGTLDMYNGAYTGTRQFDILYSPYFFRDGAHAGAVMAGPVGDQASQVLQERYDARMLGVGRLGTYNLMLKEPITSIADIAGRKIRTPQIEGCIASVEALGGNPTPVAFNEVYLALQQGVVDGLVTALNVAVAVQFYEVCQYVVANDFGQALDKQLISNASWNALSSDHQNVLATSFTELEEEFYYAAGVAAKPNDLAAWAAANGDDSVITLDEDLDAAMSGLNERLSTEVYGEGSWEQIQQA